MQAKLEEFNEVFIEQIKSNLKEIVKDETRDIIKEEFSDPEKVSSIVNLLQKHVSSLMKSNIVLRKNILNLSFLLTIMSRIAAEDVLELLIYLKKKRKHAKMY